MLIVGLLVAGFACKKSSEADGPVNVGGFLESGTWRISSLTGGGQDETAQFSGYTFSFAANGAVTATDSVVSATGYWGAGLHDGVSTVTIQFQSPLGFQSLNDDWKVRNASVTRIEMSDTVGGGGMDVLVLERN